MPEGRWWIAMVTFERRTEDQDILDETDQGAVGWLAALARGEDEARRLLVRDIEQVGLRVLEIADVREVFTVEEIAEFDAHLAKNFWHIEAGKQTVWGTIHCYAGDGEA
jgi:hypothetical protein